MGKEIVTTKGKGNGNKLLDLVQKQSSQFQMALGRNITPERFVRVAMTTLRTNKDLMQCDPKSVLAALMHCAQLSLEPGPLGQAYLVPFSNECVFIPGYQGLIELAYRSGKVTSIYAELVHETDHFEVVLGTERRLIHTPPAFGDERGGVIGVYAVAHLANGAAPQFMTLTRQEVEVFRQMSRGKNSPAWKNHWNAMAKKTAVRQLAKWIPKSTELQKAVALEDVAEDPSKGVQSDWLDNDAAFKETPDVIDGESTEQPAA